MHRCMPCGHLVRGDLAVGDLGRLDLAGVVGVVVDDEYAAVGTANFDNRSFRLNFEVTCLAHDRAFCADVEAMLEADFARATRLTEQDFNEKSLPFRVAARSTRLLAPVL